MFSLKYMARSKEKQIPESQGVADSADSEADDYDGYVERIYYWYYVESSGGP